MSWYSKSSQSQQNKIVIDQARQDLEKYSEIINKDENKVKVNGQANGLDIIDQEFSRLK